MLAQGSVEETAVARHKNKDKSPASAGKNTAAAPKPAEFRGNALESALKGLKGELKAKLAAEADAARAKVEQERARKKAAAEAPRKNVEEPVDARTLLGRAYGGVTRLGDKKLAPKGSEPARARVHAPVPTAPARDTTAMRDLDALVGGGIRFRADVDEDGRVSAYRMDHGPHLLKQLRAESPAARVDLHGMTADAADEAVVKFIRSAAQQRHRAVLVIHGKGLHSEGGQSILAERATNTLLRGRAASWVLAAETAPESRGGLGALLVLLTKQ